MAAWEQDRMANVEHICDKSRDGEDAKDGKVAVEDLIEECGVLHPLEEEVQRGEGTPREERHEQRVRG
jgi:hypothetical protein